MILANMRKDIRYMMIEIRMVFFIEVEFILSFQRRVRQF